MSAPDRLRLERDALAERLEQETAIVEELLDKLPPPHVDPWQTAPELSRRLLDAAIRATRTERELELVDATLARREIDLRHSGARV